MKRVVVLASGRGSHFECLHTYCKAHADTLTLVGVVCNKAEALVLSKAADAGIGTALVTATGAAFEPLLEQAINDFEPDIILLAGFMKILSADFVAGFTGRLFNVHPSLLPKYKGLHTHRRALEANDAEHGATVHLVTAALDGGPIVAYCQLPILPNDTEASLSTRLLPLEHMLFSTVLGWLATDRLTWNKVKLRLEFNGDPLPLTGIAVTTK